MNLSPVLKSILFESPSPYLDGNYLDSLYDDPRELEDKLLKGVYKGHIRVGGNKYILYVEDLPTGVEYAFLDLDKTKILAAHAFEPRKFMGKPACFNLMVWNSPENKGFILKWFDEHILKKYDYFISAEGVSDRGIIFWKKLYETYVYGKKTHSLQVYDKKNNKLTSVDNFNDLSNYRKSRDGENFLFVLRKV
jgi:hypothetical protein